MSKRSAVILASLAVSALIVTGRASAARSGANGFVLEPSSIPPEEILSGGPARDGIPALYDPETHPASGSPWSDDQMVIGVVRGETARAYPIAILNWHELVNDTLGGESVLVSYCPLCGTGIVFDRRIGGRVRSFGVSGLLYKSDLLLYDRETESLWSQISSEAVTGPSLGLRLELLRSEMVPWGDWKTRHPDTTVLSPETGHTRDYGRSPYGEYSQSERVFFPTPIDRRYHPKEPTLGIRLLSGPARAYPAEEIVKAGGRVVDELEGRRIVVRYDAERQVFNADAPPEVEMIEGYWFAWAAFHPETTVFVAGDGAAAP
jgi:hypothetical protein